MKNHFESFHFQRFNSITVTRGQYETRNFNLVPFTSRCFLAYSISDKVKLVDPKNMDTSMRAELSASLINFNPNPFFKSEKT